MRNTFFSLLLLAASQVNAQSATDEVPGLIASERRQFAARQDARTSSVSSNNYDVQYYRCRWEVTPQARFINGSVMMRFKATAAAGTITLDLHNQLSVDSVVYHGANITFTRGTDNSLRVTFPATIPSGALDSIRVHYQGTPPNTGYFITTTHSGTPVLYTQSESYGASHWWPCKDLNVDKADSVDLYITYPSTYVASSNGMVASETTSGGSKTTWFRHRYPISTYLVAIAVTNYTVSNDVAVLPSRSVPLTLHSYPENTAAFQSVLATAKYCMQEFSPLITEYPFSGERYGQTQWNIGGGMEHQTNTFLGGTAPSLVAHELAHQWFGDKVTCRSWSHIWLNEGFATYMEFQYMLLTSPASRVPYLQSWINTITASTGGSVYILPADTLDENRIFDNRLTYKKGGYLGVMLRWKLGDSTFYRGIRRYLNDPLVAYGTAVTADLQRNLEAESGQSLTEFFNDWFYGQGYPNYSATWTPTNGGSVQVTLNQTQSNASVSFFEMPVPLQFKNATRDTTVIANHTQTGQAFTFNLGFVPDTMFIDPQLWILSKTKTTQRVLTAVPNLEWNDRVQLYPNPAHSSVQVSLPTGAAGSYSYRLINAAGQTVAAGTLAGSGNNRRIGLDGIAPGVYWIELSDRRGLLARKQVQVSR